MTKRTPPKVDDAPGIVWRPLKHGRWRCFWQARTDLVARGYRPRTYPLWTGIEPTDTDGAKISDDCHRQQSEMLLWGRGGVPVAVDSFDGTLAGLIRAYQTDKDSTFRGLRFRTRENQIALLRRLERDHGHMLVREIKGRTVIAWHKEWLGDENKVHMAHGFVGLLRTLIRFGMTILDDEDCTKLAGVLSGQRFKMGGHRKHILTAAHAIAIRAKAHEIGLPSIALAQAFQFELLLRQKDVIGEWVPFSEPGLSDITSGNEKWLWGLRWNEIDHRMWLTHVTSKRQKDIERDLTLYPMIMEELRRIYGFEPGMSRSVLPGDGAVIVYEKTLRPYESYQFRQQWRQIASAAGVPKEVYNMDSRAGGITEGSNAGASLEDLRHAATHSDIGMTQRYSRDDAGKAANVARLRAADRKNKAGS